MAPSPTGWLHIGNVRTALFNWLFARHEGGEFRLRIENTDTSREVQEAVEQIQESLRWLGLDWDGPVTFQLDRSDLCREEARKLVEEGKAYEDEGAIRFRMPDEGITAWEDVVLGRVEFPNERLEDVVVVRSDGRPTYNFASPIEDRLDEITHVIRGPDHISNTPKQIRILEGLGAPLPVYAHVPNVNGGDGRKLSKRHGAVTVEEFRAQGYLPEALVNFLALLGWSYDDRTTIMSREDLVERFSLERVGASPATFDYQKLDWMNGVYIRGLSPKEFADRLVAYLREREIDWGEPVEAVDGFDEAGRAMLAAAGRSLAEVEPFEAEPIEQALRSAADELGLKPRQAFQPIRVAVTGSTVSPGLFESLELLGRETSLERIRRAAGA